MITGAQPMACGNCCHGTFRVFTTEPTKQLLLECGSCQSVSVIKVGEPALVIDWGPGANAVITRMAPTS